MSKPLRLWSSPALAPIRSLAPYYLLGLAILLFYGNIFYNVWLYDDDDLIRHNPALADWHSIFTYFTQATMARDGVGMFYRPLQMSLYILIDHAVGLSLFAFHALNLGLHVANAGLVYGLGRRLGFDRHVTFASTLIWALHPLHTEAVTYMSATADVLYVFFCLVALVVVLPDFQPRRVIIALVCMALALCSKESALILPLLMMACRYLQPNKQSLLRTYSVIWPFWAVAVLYAVLRYLFLPVHPLQFLNADPDSVTYGSHVLTRIYSCLATLPSYTELLVYPHDLHMNRGFPLYLDAMHWEVGGGALLIVCAALYVKFMRNAAHRPLQWGILWFGAGHFMQTGVIVPINALLLEHWMYLPSIGLCLGGGETISLWLRLHAIHFERYQRAVFAGALGLAILLGYLTYQQNGIWANPFAFYSNILRFNPHSPRAHNNLGLAYMEHGDFKPAIQQFLEAMHDDDLDPLAPTNIGVLFTKIAEGPAQLRTAADWFQKALLVDSLYLPACEDLAKTYQALGDTAGAQHYFARAQMIREHQKDRSFESRN